MSLLNQASVSLLNQASMSLLNQASMSLLNQASMQSLNQASMPLGIPIETLSESHVLIPRNCSNSFAS